MSWPKANTAYTFQFPGLVSQANTKVFQTSPTLAAGDVKVIKNGVAANIATLPTLANDNIVLVVTLSASEVGDAGNRVTVRFKDAAGNEWCDAGVSFLVAARDIDDLVYLSYGGSITTVSPVLSTGDVETWQGYDYNAADGTSLEWPNEAGTWPDLTGATITFYLDDGENTFTGSVVTPTGNQKVRLELTAVQSAAIRAGRHDYQIRATLANTRKAPLGRGSWVSVDTEQA